MSDNQLVQELQSDILSAVNKSNLPMAVKVLALENILLKASNALKDQMEDEKNSSKKG